MLKGETKLLRQGVASKETRGHSADDEEGDAIEADRLNVEVEEEGQLKYEDGAGAQDGRPALVIYDDPACGGGSSIDVILDDNATLH